MSTSRILVIDDDPAVLTALPEMFRLWMPGTLVDLCASARLALDRIEDTDYDAIVSDIRMPDMDGLSLLEHIKAVRPQTPTLLITGYGDQSMATQALRGGAYDYILKPVDRDYLLGSVSRAIHLRQVSRQAEEHKQIEIALRESQQSLHAIIELVPCLLVVADAAGRLLLFNRAAEQLTGYGREEVLGQAILDVFVPPQWTDQVRDRLTNLDGGAQPPYHNPWRTKAGEERMIEWHCTGITWPPRQERCLLAVGIDMSERRRTEQQISALNTELDQRVQAYAKVVSDLRRSKAELQEKIADLETFQDVVVGRELRMIALEKQVAELQRKLNDASVKQAQA